MFFESILPVGYRLFKKWKIWLSAEEKHKIKKNKDNLNLQFRFLMGIRKANFEVPAGDFLRNAKYGSDNGRQFKILYVS